MEPPLKRVRLLEQDESGQSNAYDSDDYSDLYDDEDTALDADEDVQEGADDIPDQEDPDFQLEQKRARLDLKLKSKFEAIFEKYGRDFTGIGDEIDLETGEIVVNNGHLLEMEDERDDGTARPSLLEAFTQGPDETLDFTEAEESESDEIHDSHVKLEDMEEDDMILFQGAGVLSGKPKTPPTRSLSLQELLPHQHEASHISAPSKCSYPSENEIIAQFGQELGPEIARYVSQKRIQDDSTVEPAWRTPGLPLATPGRRPILKSILLQPDIDRSPSPKGSSSVWAPKRPRGRPRRDGADAAAVFRGETIIRDRTWYSSGYVSTTVTKQRTERVDQSHARRTMSVPLNETLNSGKHRPGRSLWPQSNQSNAIDKYSIGSVSDREPDSSDEKVAQYYKPRRWSNPGLKIGQGTSPDLNMQHTTSHPKSKDGPLSKEGRALKVPFTPDDDKALLEWVEEALGRGFALWSWTHWKMLAEKNPRHTHLSWLDRYRRRFWQKGIVPSLREEDSGGSLREGTDTSETVHQTVMISDSELEDSSSPDESSWEMFQKAALSDSKSFPNPSSQRDSGEISRAEPFGTMAVLDPALDPALFELPNKTEGSASPEPQRSKPGQISHPPATIFDSGIVVYSNTSNNIPEVTSPSSSSRLQEVGFKAESPPILGEDGGRISGADSIDVGADQTEIGGIKINEGDNTSQKALADDFENVMKEESRSPAAQSLPKVASNDTNERDAQLPSSVPNSFADADAQLSSAIRSPLHTTVKNPGVKSVKHFPLSSFDAAYGFSDDEDAVDIVPVKPRASFRLQTSKTSTYRTSVIAQRVDTNVKDSAIHQTPTDRGTLRGSPRARNQSPISISSSSPVSAQPELVEDNFFLKPSAPAHPVSDSNMTLSGILGSENLEVPSQEKFKAYQLEEGRKGPPDDVRPSPSRTSSPKRRTPKSITRASILRRNMEGRPSCPMVETPGGSLKRCGEKGFRCGKDFCFKCMAD